MSIIVEIILQAEKGIEILMFFFTKLEEREDVQDLGVNGRVILKRNLKK